MAEHTDRRYGESSGSGPEPHGEDPELGPGKRSLVDTTFAEGGRAPTRAGKMSRVQQLQRKQALGAAADPGAPPAEAMASAPGASAAQVIVDDEAAAVGPGQVKKSTLIAQLKPLLEEAASEELGALFATAGCPYIAHYLAMYGQRSARECEAFIRRFTGSKATTTPALVADLLVRVRAGVKAWRSSGQVPAELAAAAGGGAPPPAAAPAAATGGLAIQHKDEPGATRPTTAPAGTPAAVLEQLGEGAPLDGTTRARMESAFGTSFGDVRVHADAKGAALAGQHGALAFTVGAHIAVAAGRYAPGTPEGDALLAHELTHVLQQRGAAPGSEATNAVTGQNPGAEHDADQGAEAALRRLHGGEKEKDKDKKAGAKLSTDFQLQRCIGTAEAPTLYGPGMFHQNAYTWDGDPFAVMLEYHAGKPIGGTPTPGWLEFSAKYAGGDDSNGDVAVMQSGGLQPGKNISPSLAFDRSDGWSKLTVDLYGDGSWVADIRHTTVFTEGWTPKTRTHQFDGRRGDKAFTTPHPVIVKSKDAVPASSQDKQPANNQTAAPAPPVRVDVAVQVAKRHLDDLMADPNLQLDAKAAPWAALKPKIDAAATKYASTTTDDAGDGARLTRVGDAMQQAKPMLVALGAASHKEAFLPDIADQCLELVKGVRAQFVAAVGAAWDGDASAQMQAAMKAFEVMWYRVSSLYLAQGKGAGAMLDNARATAQQVLLISNRAGMGVPKLQAALGVTTGPPTGGDVITQKNHELAQIREDFMAGKPGALGRTTKIVEDAQVLTGLASILVFGELFRKFKDELKGITGGVMDTFGRDLSAVCDDYIGTFDGMARGVEDKIAGHDPKLTEIGRPAVDRLQQLTNSEKFKTDVKAIESRIKNIALVQTLAKVLVIVGAAALTAGVAGAAVGGALEGAGATAGIVATGEFAAEVTAFTLVSRAGNQVAFGKNETSLAEDLITNAVMLGALKAASAAYGRVFKIFADPKKYKIRYGAGAAATGFVTLQAFAEAHYAFKHDGKLMDGDERAQSLIQNAVMFAALTLGGFLARPLNQRVRGQVLLKVAGPRLAAIEGHLAALGGEVEALKTDPKGPDHAAELCKKIEGLWNEELRQLGEAAKAEKENPTKAAEEFKATVAAYQTEIAKLDLQLSQMGLEVQLSPKMEGNLFRAIRPGYVAFRPEGLEVLKDFYVKDGGTLTELKDGQLAGKSKAGDEVYYVPEDKVAGVFEAQRAKPPTESEAVANHAEAERARKQLQLRSQKCTELLVGKLVDGHVTHKFGRIIQGTGLAAALDANTLPGAQKGVDPVALAALPDTIGVGTGADTFAKLGDIPIGQAAPELGGPGWAMEPGQFSAAHGKYAPASTLADATSVTQYRSGTPIVDAAVLELSTTPDATWKVPDAKVRIKVKLAGHGEVFLYGDATDIALGLGKPRELELNKIAPDEPTAKQYKQQLEANGRLVYGDQPAQQKGGKILVSGGSATAAWNARYARGLGAEVDWVAEDRSPTKAPTSNDSVRRYERVQKMLDNGEITPGDAAKEMAEIRAFDAAALPTNVQAKDAAMSDAGIKRSVKGITALKPVGDAKVEVTFTDGTKEVYDQVVVSHATAIDAASGPGPAGAVTIGANAGVKFKPVVRNGKVVALESVDPPGAVRVIGAAMWSGAWIDFVATDITMPDPMRPNVEISAQQVFVNALKNQAKGAPRDSPASALVHHVAEQVPAANR